ncbi:hypothetical protein AVEN_223479-1 [Araneus ventricosus]|uniref:Uncharacterized protein n=1 Tax=Araneus ventricosus TaxID=182803 RepID=A0A4Y2ETW5_ARAVE|nr:hypothetical protein AVEN_223479-1 [Araneus ventricosus]
MGLVILSHGQITRTTPSLQISTAHQRGDVWPPMYDLAYSGPTHKTDLQWNRVSGLESPARGRHLTIRPPRPHFMALIRERSEAAVAKSQLQPQTAPGPKPGSIEDPLRLGPAVRQIICRGQTLFRWCGERAWRGEAQFKRRRRHLAAAQNYEVRPKIASSCFKTGR